MSEIKSVSWSGARMPSTCCLYRRLIAFIESEDVPSFQKKVTERHREPITSTGRSFVIMQEITDSIKQGGQRGNRGEMSEVKAFMKLNGVESVFNIVLGF